MRPELNPVRPAIKSNPDQNRAALELATGPVRAEPETKARDTDPGRESFQAVRVNQAITDFRQLNKKAETLLTDFDNKNRSGRESFATSPDSRINSILISNLNRVKTKAQEQISRQAWQVERVAEHQVDFLRNCRTPELYQEIVKTINERRCQGFNGLADLSPEQIGRIEADTGLRLTRAQLVSQTWRINRYRQLLAPEISPGGNNGQTGAGELLGKIASLKQRFDQLINQTVGANLQQLVSFSRQQLARFGLYNSVQQDLIKETSRHRQQIGKDQLPTPSELLNRQARISCLLADSINPGIIYPNSDFEPDPLRAINSEGQLRANGLLINSQGLVDRLGRNQQQLLEINLEIRVDHQLLEAILTTEIEAAWRFKTSLKQQLPASCRGIKGSMDRISTHYFDQAVASYDKDIETENNLPERTDGSRNLRLIKT